MISENYKTKEDAEITVVLDTRHAHALKRFRCVVCGNILFEYTEPIHIILAGGPETLKTPTVVQCPHSIKIPKQHGGPVFVRCKTRYFIIK